MATSPSISKPLVGLLLAGLTYIGIRSLGSQRATSQVPVVTQPEPNALPPVTPSIVKSVPTKKVSQDVFPLQLGSRNTMVTALQKSLGVSPTGYFGSKTLAALKAKYNIVSVSKEYFASITAGPAASAATAASQPQKGQWVISSVPYKLPVGVTVPAGFLLGYATGKFNTTADLVTPVTLEVTCLIDGRQPGCPEYLKQYHGKRLTYWVRKQDCKLFYFATTVFVAYPNLKVSSTFIRP